jgi:hypothetical protein
VPAHESPADWLAEPCWTASASGGSLVPAGASVMSARGRGPPAAAGALGTRKPPDAAVWCRVPLSMAARGPAGVLAGAGQ